MIVPDEFRITPKELQEVDDGIRQLVIDLNAAGYYTQSSCQGKTSWKDVECGYHCDHSFITFFSDGLDGRKTKAKKLRLDIYNGDISISALNGRESSWEEIFEKNKQFESKIRQLFSL